MSSQGRLVPQHAAWDGWLVHDCRGGRVGTVEACFGDDGAEAPAWLLLRLARFSTRYALVPPATLLAGDARLWLPYARETIERAPLLFAIPPAIDRVLQRRLRAHYRISGDAPPEVRARAGRTPAE